MNAICPTCSREVDVEAGCCSECGPVSVSVAPLAGDAQLLPQEVSSPARASDTHLEGLSGWLIWIGFGLVLAPLKMLNTLLSVSIPLLSKASTQAYLAKHHAVTVLVGSEIVMNILFIMSLVFLNYLFFARKRGFPTYMIIFRIVNVILLLGNHIAFRLTTPLRSPQGTIAVLTSIVGALIVIPYMLISRLVRVTFVR